MLLCAALWLVVGCSCSKSCPSTTCQLARFTQLRCSMNARRVPRICNVRLAPSAATSTLLVALSIIGKWPDKGRNGVPSWCTPRLGRSTATGTATAGPCTDHSLNHIWGIRPLQNRALPVVGRIWGSSMGFCSCAYCKRSRGGSISGYTLCSSLTIRRCRRFRLLGPPTDYLSPRHQVSTFKGCSMTRDTTSIVHRSILCRSRFKSPTVAAPYMLHQYLKPDCLN